LLQETSETHDIAVKCMLRKISDSQLFKEQHFSRLMFCEGDLLQPQSLDLAFDNAWAVINLAGLREFWSQDRTLFYDLNQTGARNVFEACLRQRVEKVVQVSTPLSFGVPGTIPFTESTPAGKNHPSDYARSKYLGDQDGLKLMREEGLPLVIVYLAAVIGAGDEHDTMEIRRVVNGKLPALVGANNTYIYVYAKDAAEAIARALFLTSSIGRQYLVGKTRATTREYFELIGDMADVTIPRFNIPEKMLIPVAIIMEYIAKYSGKRPQLPLDVIKTVAAGSLLFDASRSEDELGMQYTPLSVALKEAVAFVKEEDISSR